MVIYCCAYNLLGVGEDYWIELYLHGYGHADAEDNCAVLQGGGVPVNRHYPVEFAYRVVNCVRYYVEWFRSVCDIALLENSRGQVDQLVRYEREWYDQACDGVVDQRFERGVGFVFFS